MKYIVHADGGARGNPGRAAVGVVIDLCECNDTHMQGRHNTKRIYTLGKPIGETTNNIAEYKAVIEALQHLVFLKKQREEVKAKISVEIHLDSTLVVNQINGMFKVKNEALRNLLYTIRILEEEVGKSIVYISIPREHNKDADFLVNKALDANTPVS